MPRFFIEVAYKGTRYSGFQIQQNANTIQSEIEKAINILFGTRSAIPTEEYKSGIKLTGSSRTDTGVHALQNFFHFDFDGEVHEQFIYKINSLLPPDIVIKHLYKMPLDAHCRFDAVSREYEYRIYNFKDPFLKETAFYYPYKINYDLLQQTAAIIADQNNFFAFSKTNTQVKNYSCIIYKSSWINKDGLLIYIIKGNRFLRGMVRLLTATQLKVARGKLSLESFASLFDSTSEKCNFSVPAAGLFLKQVKFPENYFPSPASLSQHFYK